MCLWVGTVPVIRLPGGTLFGGPRRIGSSSSTKICLRTLPLLLFLSLLLSSFHFHVCCPILGVVYKPFNNIMPVTMERVRRAGLRCDSYIRWTLDSFSHKYCNWRLRIQVKCFKAPYKFFSVKLSILCQLTLISRTRHECCVFWSVLLSRWAATVTTCCTAAAVSSLTAVYYPHCQGPSFASNYLGLLPQ